MKTRHAVNAFLLLLSITAALVLGEFSFRTLLFSTSSLLSKIRQPYQFTSIFEDNYWKLYEIWDGKYKPPAKPHHLLGWVGNFSRESYLHVDAEQVGHRQPVLLYGDSFAQCASAAGGECFQHILNADPAFSRSYYLLNYGVGGYGVDQVFLLLDASLPLYETPLVIVGIFTDDIDRCILRFRIGQKPYFEVDHGQLALRGIPIASDPRKYLDQHPISINSYVFRLWLHSNHFPQALPKYYESQAKRDIVTLSSLLLEKLVHTLDDKRAQYLFVVFASQE